MDQFWGTMGGDEALLPPVGRDIGALPLPPAIDPREKLFPSALDRLLAAHPLLAERAIDHVLADVRVAAALHASVFRLPGLLTDPDPRVRLLVALRLPSSRTLSLYDDQERLVHQAVSQRHKGLRLWELLEGEVHSIGQTVVRHLSPDQWHHAAADPDPEIRRCIARLLPDADLPLLSCDSDPLVRLELVARLPVQALTAFADDPDFLVRFAVAERLDVADLAVFLDDREETIRDLADRRLLAVSERHVSRVMGETSSEMAVDPSQARELVQ